MENSEHRRQSKFIWNEGLSTTALREVYYTKSYQYVAGTGDSATAWKTCIAHLIKHRAEFEALTVEKLRDHEQNLLKNRAKVVRELEKQSGVVEEETEMKSIMDSIIEEREYFLSEQTNKKDKEKEAEAAKEVRGKDCRMKAMETVGDTRKRKSEAGDSPETGKKEPYDQYKNHMIDFLEKRSAERQAVHKADLKMRQNEMEARNDESEAVNSGMLQMMTVMQEQMNFNRDQPKVDHEKEERDRREKEEERRLQREEQTNQQHQMTALLGALIKKLGK